MSAPLPAGAYTAAVPEPQGGTRPTIVLLGASNLTRGISTVVETLRLQYQRPLRVVAALGHGRSYGQRSSVLGRSLAGILDCGLWNALEDTAATPSFALLTDIGNDVIYGAAPTTIIGWIDECIDRLCALPGGGVDRINITALPIDSIRRIKPWHFAIVKNVLFPRHAITYGDAMERSFELQQMVEDVAHRRGDRVRLVHHERAWYGFDPIHVRMRHWPLAWTRFLSREEANGDLRAVGSFARWQRLRRHMPAEYRILGIARRRMQPLILDESTTLELF